jgi:glycosyltransferase involved in cell wall biosynthesis
MNNFTDSNPMVTVLMPMFNAEKYVVASINSCIRQTYQNWELLIVDDCSSDDSVKVVNQFEDSRIRLYRLDKNFGPGYARNIALDNAKGDWITVLDADDAFGANRISSLLKIAQEIGANFVVNDKPISWNGNDEIWANRLIPETDLQRRQIKKVSLETWISQIGYSKPFFHRKLLLENVRYPEDIKGPEDTVFFVRLCALNDVQIAGVELENYHYRRNTESLSNRGLPQLTEINTAIKTMRTIPQLKGEIRASLDLMQKKNDVNLLAIDIRKRFNSRELLSIIGVLYRNRFLLPELFALARKSIMYNLSSSKRNM